MKPVNSGGNTTYQNHILKQLLKYYPDSTDSLPDSSLLIINKFWNNDMSGVDSLLQDRYSSFGSETNFPSDMLHSILVSGELKITSYEVSRCRAENRTLRIPLTKDEQKSDTPNCTFEEAHSIAKYGRNVYLVLMIARNF